MRKHIYEAAKSLFHLPLRLITPISLNKLDHRKKLEAFHNESHRKLHRILSSVISEASKK